MAEVLALLVSWGNIRVHPAGLVDSQGDYVVFALGSFFFQAEDGIRDDLVTGVQTCALPICGFYLALDRDFKAAHARWWRTTAGFAVPFERVGLQPPPSEFHGSWIRYDEDRKSVV